MLTADRAGARRRVLVVEDEYIRADFFTGLLEQ
jgi:hypothetical protein